MSEISFWDKDTATVSSIIESICRLCKNTYVWVTNLKTHESWCSKEMKNFFHLEHQAYNNFEQAMEDYVHPYDLEEYLDGINKRIHGLDLNEEFCIRFRDMGGSYSFFTIHTEMIGDDAALPSFLIVLLKNENTLPELDALTGLYSYAKYADDLNKNIAERTRLAVLQIQVDGFTNFALIYGTNFASELLRQIALQFIYMMDFDKAVYRLEGEQFVFILKKCGREELIRFEQQIRSLLSAGIMAAGKMTSLKISSGAILLDNYYGESSSVRSQVAYALSHSVHKHQGQLVIFNDEVQTDHGTDLELMKIIHQSVRDNCKGFYVEYQPVVDSNTGATVGAEALVRWRCEPYGNVPPGMFIEWMETDPSMYELGNFVLQTALSETVHLLDTNPDFFVNVNISAKQLERPEFRKAVLKILEETGFPADNLCMELTERCKDFPLDILKQEVAFFQSYGIKVAMDDYGTGSASSNIVMNVPMDELKIDMSFIRGIMDNPKNQAMVRSILDFAGKAGMTTCLEGVENETLESYLRGYHATWFQGYYYAKPLPIQQLEEFLHQPSMK